MAFRPPKGVRPPQLEGKRTGRPKKVKELTPSQESEGTLAAMRHVISTPPASDTTYQRRELRKWLEKNRNGFMRLLLKLEEAELTRRGPLQLEVVDAVTHRLETIMVQWLERNVRNAGIQSGIRGEQQERRSSQPQEGGNSQRRSIEKEDFLEDFLEQ
jgi:hypothetical protein